MERVDKNIQRYVQLVTFLLIWVLLLYVTGDASTLDFWTAVKKIPLAVTLYAALGLIFVRWLWRLPILMGWLIKIPDLEGTWRGELKSDWVNPQTMKGIDPIPVILVIRQNFYKISCTLMTSESTSYSTAVELNKIYGGEDLYLTYTYTNRPKVTLQDRSAIHDGAAALKVLKGDVRQLEGEYWTSRKTRGELSLSFVGRELIEKFR